ncbi:MAG: alpha-amylase family glycosyl hydrolase [Verrucomicrobiales bacterium]
MCVGMAASVAARSWTDEVMYFVMTDRFHDGDPANNVPVGSDPALFDARQEKVASYMGGDLRGLENAVEAGYFNELGVTALWLTPVVRNVWRSGFDLGGPKTGYHGYWTQDWLDIDPHLTSRVSLAGEEYADSADGRMAHYRDFVKLAHSRGIKVIQDVVMNHAGPVFYYDANGNGEFDVKRRDEWMQPFKRNGYHANAKWRTIAKWNLRRAMPDGPRELLGTRVGTSGVLSRMGTYGRKGYSPDSLGKSDGEEVMCDFFSLRDIWTDPQGESFDELVDEFVEIYSFYLTVVGVDGLRIDTVKHVHHGFWDAFTKRLRERLGPAAAEKLMFGEVYDERPEVLGRYTWREDWPQETGPCLDSLLDFNFCFAARSYLRHPGAGYGDARVLEQAMRNRTAADAGGRSYYNPTPGPDGLNAQQKMVTFIENHDGLNRFRVEGVTAERNLLAQALVMTMPGIPCLYYGTECGLQDERGRVGRDGETGRMMLFRRRGGLSVAEVRRSKTYQQIGKLAKLRAELPVLRTGAVEPLWVDSGEGQEDDGVFAFARVLGDELAVVVVNASSKPGVTGAGEFAMGLAGEVNVAGKELRPVLVTGEGAGERLGPVSTDGKLRLPVPANSVVVYQALPVSR